MVAAGVVTAFEKELRMQYERKRRNGQVGQRDHYRLRHRIESLVLTKFLERIGVDPAYESGTLATVILE